jgi:hypothetical protein
VNLQSVYIEWRWADEVESPMDFDAKEENHYRFDAEAGMSTQFTRPSLFLSLCWKTPGQFIIDALGPYTSFI